MPFISITRLRIRSPWYLPAFFFHALKSSMQAKKAPGNLAFDALSDANRTFWTKTAWQDEASMRAFMLSGAHRVVMPKLAGWCDEAAVAHWTQDTAILPDWAEAHRRLVASGRKSKVKHPSTDHEAFRIPPPRT
ncbi:MAG: DUF3291 domain-containing protein [Acidobacteriota bacterium]